MNPQPPALKDKVLTTGKSPVDSTFKTHTISGHLSLSQMLKLSSESFPSLPWTRTAASYLVLQPPSRLLQCIRHTAARVVLESPVSVLTHTCSTRTHILLAKTSGRSPCNQNRLLPALPPHRLCSLCISVAAPLRSPAHVAFAPCLGPSHCGNTSPLGLWKVRNARLASALLLQGRSSTPDFLSQGSVPPFLVALAASERFSVVVFKSLLSLPPHPHVEVSSSRTRGLHLCVPRSTMQQRDGLAVQGGPDLTVIWTSKIF